MGTTLISFRRKIENDSWLLSEPQDQEALDFPLYKGGYGERVLEATHPPLKIGFSYVKTRFLGAGCVASKKGYQSNPKGGRRTPVSEDKRAANR